MLQPKEIRAYVEANPNLVAARESKKYPGLFVVKYKNKVFYDALWTKELEEMRGLVVDKDYNVVIRPFDKIYNYNENEATIPLEESVIAVEKINGFMAALTFVPDYGLMVSTTGSLDSPFVELATRHMSSKLLSWVLAQREHTTYLFEVCDQEEDPHIIQESQGLHIIGARNVHTGQLYNEEQLDILQEQLGDAGVITRRPRWSITTFGQVLHWTKVAQHEGYVVYGKTTTLKVKTPFYLTAKFLARVKPDKLEHALVNRARVDEEFYPLLDKIAADKAHFDSLDEQARLVYIREFFYG